MLRYHAIDDITGIFEIKDETLKMKNEGAVYDLSGRRISADANSLPVTLNKGIYIINGKKVVIK